MQLFSAAALVMGVFAVHARATDFQTFCSKNQNDTSLRYVPNSGVCETTPGVKQYSGYVDVGTNMSMWFWFFEARHSPESAPFTLWLNGGPGCSSMVGLFIENGPCHVNEDGTTTSLNPYSWNNVSNMLYIDQPIGSGFSYGTDEVNSTASAATFVWKAFQILFESQVFAKYESREFIFATESYGGHYAPGFVSYFDQQNNLIASGAIKGERIVTSAIMLNNGWTDPLTQYKSYYNFTADAPGYGQIQPDDVLKDIYGALYDPNGCVAQEEACIAAGNSTQSINICNQADNYCINNVYFPALGNLDPYDIKQTWPPSFPPEYYTNYLNISEVVKKIGAETTYVECSEPTYNLFTETADRARSLLPELSKLVNSGLRVLIWAGDRDLMYVHTPSSASFSFTINNSNSCNWLGVYETMLAMEWYGKETFHNTPLRNMTLDGTPVAAVANVDNFSFARVFGAGHELPAFQPAAALKIFTQIINKEPLHSM